MRYSDIIMERATGILYHRTKLEATASILQQGVFKLSDARNDKYQEQLIIKQSYPYYLSTTRSKDGSFCRRSECPVTFVLDGEFLNQKGYITKPVDADMIWYKFRNKMAEDRVWSNKNLIPIDGVIKEIHVLIDFAIFYGSTSKRIRHYTIDRNIPLFYYDRNYEEDFRILNKRAAIKQEKKNGLR